MNDAGLPPQGARWNQPFDEPPPAPEGSCEVPPASVPSTPAETSVPTMGIIVPISAADFRDRWRELSPYARVDRAVYADYVAQFTAFGSSPPFSLDQEQEAALQRTGSFTLRLPQIQALNNPTVTQPPFTYRHSLCAVDYTEWQVLYHQRLVSPDSLSEAQLAHLKDFIPFDEAYEAIADPLNVMSVPISLEEVKKNWGTWSALRILKKRTLSPFMIDEIERRGGSIYVKSKWLTEEQTKDLTERGYTYLTLDQVSQMYSSRLKRSLPISTWLTLRDQGLVSDDHLSRGEVSRLSIHPYFKKLLEEKFLGPEKKRQESELFRQGLLGLAIIVGIVAVVGYYIYRIVR